MKSKYYIPEIEDLFVGYKCDYIYPDESDVWKETELDSSDIYHFDEQVRNKLDTYQIRTKYLNKESIESLKYKFKSEYKDEMNFEKGDIYQIGGEFLDYNINTKVLNIVRNQGKFDNSGTPTGKTVFQGKVKSLNELTKLLKMICY